MRNTKNKLFPIALAICMMLSVTLCKSANATIDSSNYLDWYMAFLTAKSDGVISVSVNIEACGDMKQVGASKIVMYESEDGTVFKPVKTYKYDEYPAMMGSGWDHVATVVTYDGTPGYAYYAIVYCYAGNSTGHDEKSYTTSIVYAHK